MADDSTNAGMRGIPATFNVGDPAIDGSEFGPVVAVTNAILLPGYTAVHPIGIRIHKNDDGYTAIINELPAILGYGDSAYDASEDVKCSLVDIRGRYGSLSEDECTKDAVRLRDRLIRYLEVVP